jgi:hypothetical protein
LPAAAQVERKRSGSGAQPSIILPCPFPRRRHRGAVRRGREAGRPEAEARPRTDRRSGGGGQGQADQPGPEAGHRRVLFAVAGAVRGRLPVRPREGRRPRRDHARVRRRGRPRLLGRSRPLPGRRRPVLRRRPPPARQDAVRVHAADRRRPGHPAAATRLGPPAGRPASARHRWPGRGSGLPSGTTPAGCERRPTGGGPWPSPRT